VQRIIFVVFERGRAPDADQTEEFEQRTKTAGHGCVKWI